MYLLRTLKDLSTVYIILMSKFVSVTYVCRVSRYTEYEQADTYGAFERLEVNSILMSEKKPRGIIMSGDRAELPPFFPNSLAVEPVIFRKRAAALVTHVLPGRNYQEVGDSKSETRSITFRFATHWIARNA